MSLSETNTNSTDRLSLSPNGGTDATVDWSRIYQTEVAPLSTTTSAVGNVLPEIPAITARPVMYAQLTELPALQPPTQAPATDAQPANRPQRVEVPVLDDAVARLQQAQRPDVRLPFQIQVFLAREVGMAALADSFVERPNFRGPANPTYCDAAIAALQTNLQHMRQGTGTGWQIEAAVTQGLLGFAQLHRSGIGEDLNQATVARQQARGGNAANFANSGLQNLRDAREALQRLLNPAPGTAALPQEVQREIRAILAALPVVNNQGPGGALQLTNTYNFSSDPLIQIGMRHGRQAMQQFAR